MTQINTVPAPELNLPRPPENKWQREYAAFVRLLPDLLKTDRDQYVAIHEGRVVVQGTGLIDVAMQAYARHGYVPIYVGQVTDRPIVSVRMPSPRLVEREKPS